MRLIGYDRRRSAKGSAMRLVFRRAAKKMLDRIQPDRRRQILYRLKELAADPTSRSADIKPLAGSNSLRLRVGDYRILFTPDGEEGTLTVELIRTRGDIYKRSR
jgi:mRNA interferase RelE/StbE